MKKQQSVWKKRINNGLIFLGILLVISFNATKNGLLRSQQAIQTSWIQFEGYIQQEIYLLQNFKNLETHPSQKTSQLLKTLKENQYDLFKANNFPEKLVNFKTFQINLNELQNMFDHISRRRAAPIGWANFIGEWQAAKKDSQIEYNHLKKHLAYYNQSLKKIPRNMVGPLMGFKTYPQLENQRWKK